VRKVIDTGAEPKIANSKAKSLEETFGSCSVAGGNAHGTF
jgi:hypothetical protein